MEFDQYKIIRALRLSFTCILLFFLTWYFQVPESAWALITIWFVMFEYTTVGGVLTKGLYRAIGTILSALYGMIIIYFCHNNIVTNILALTPAVMLYSYYFMDSEKAYIGLIGCVTLTIVLLNYNRIDLAIIRVFNIILGIMISMFMIRFFYPQYARVQILVVESKLIFILSQCLQSYLDQTMSMEEVKTKYLQYEQDIYLHFSTISRLLHAVKIETSKTPEYAARGKKSFEHIRVIFRLTSLFINYLPTEDIRSNKWVLSHVELLLSKLNACQRKLEGSSEELLTESFLVPPRPPRAKIMFFVRFVFDNLNKEITLLDKEIDEIVLLSEQYKVGFFKSKLVRDTIWQ